MILFIFLFAGMLMAENYIPQYFHKELQNGLKIIVVPMNRGSNVISTNLIVKVGSRNEQLGKTGIAHMLEHMAFKSTKNLKEGEFDKIVKSIGGYDNASTSFDLTHYYINTSSKHLEKSLWLLKEILANLKLEDSEFQPERKVVLEERYWRTDNDPFGLIYFTLFNTAFTYHQYHWTPIGFTEDIKSWRIEDIREFYRKYYSPNNSVIAVAGDIEPDEVFELTEQLFGNLKRKQLNFASRAEPEQLGERRVTLNRESPVEYMAIGFKIPNYIHEDQLILEFISNILTDGKSSRLYKQLVIKDRLANGVYSYNMENLDESLFMILAIANPGVSSEKIEKKIWSAIEKLKKGKISQREIDKIRNKMKKDFIFNFEKAREGAYILGRYFARGSLLPIENYIPRLEQIQKEDIAKVARKYFIRKNTTIVIYR